MTTATLFAHLRTQLAEAQRPGLAGVRALEAAAQTMDALEDAVKLADSAMRTAKCVRLGHILRHVATPEQIYEATQRARADHPEAWKGVLE